MKSKTKESISYNIDIEKTTAGRLQAGDVFLFRKNVWTVMNRSESGRFVRTLLGKYHESKTIPPDAKVKRIVSMKRSRDKSG